METIALECPSCRESLEIDGGFAGAVCRCFSCGTMMTVPADHTADRVESLQRPERPADPSDEQPPSPDVAAGQIVSQPADQAQPAQSTTFTTASGKRFHVSSSHRVPIARKRRRALRASIVVTFIVAMVTLIAIAVAAVSFAVRDRGSTTAAAGNQHDEQTVSGCAPNINPFNSTSANFLGLPVSPRTVVAIDISRAGIRWLALVEDAAVDCASKLPAGHAFQVVFWTAQNVRAYPPTLKTLSTNEVGQLKSFVGEIVALGVADPEPAVARALSGNPDKLILVTSQFLRDDQVAAIKKRIEQHPRVRLEAVLIGAEVPELEALARSTGGRVILLSPRRLERWYRDAEVRPASTVQAQPLPAQNQKPAEAKPDNSNGKLSEADPA